MTVAPALPARINLPTNRAACRGVPAVQPPIPGLTPADGAALVPPGPSTSGDKHPSGLGCPPDRDDDREAAATVWHALADELTRTGTMRLRRYSRALRRHTYPSDQPITPDLPTRPAALRLYDHRGVAHVLALDFDAKHHGAARVTDDVRQASTLLRQLGARIIEDVAASGGRHLWIPLTIPINVDQARQLATACRRLWPTLDISPTVNPTDGCLTAPGSPCKDGQYRRLVTPLAQAVDAVHHRSAHDLVPRALERLTTLSPTTQPPAPRPPATAPRPLSPVHTAIATHGTWPADRTTPDGRPWTRSEACWAVLAAAAARGWTLDDVTDHLDTGRWPGLLALYTGRYRWQWRRRLHAEWIKALTTQRPSTDPPQEQLTTGGAALRVTERDHARRWITIMMAVSDELTPTKTRHNTRALLYGLAWLAWRQGKRYVEAGTRSYARATGGMIDHTTAAEILRAVRDLPAGQCPLQLLSTGRGTHGDLYELVIPPDFEHLATDPDTWIEPRPIAGVFGTRDPDRPRHVLLGATGWRLHQVLTAGVTGTATQLARAAGISRAQAHTLLPVLVRLRLARPTTSGSHQHWQLGTASTDEAGGAVDAQAHLDAIDTRHRAERARWRMILASYAERRAATDAHTPDPGEPLWWPPAWATEPPPADDTDPAAVAVALLVEVFGAQLLADPPPPTTSRLEWIGRKRRAMQKRLSVTVSKRSNV
ncbi:MAG: hypothetical protein JXA67_12100 [Micromonosporaceae bacterium]|nr:hypothetical protein [Micromonosporaceae bacterium]